MIFIFADRLHHQVSFHSQHADTNLHSDCPFCCKADKYIYLYILFKYLFRMVCMRKGTYVSLANLSAIIDQDTNQCFELSQSKCSLQKHATL